MQGRSSRVSGRRLVEAVVASPTARSLAGLVPDGVRRKLVWWTVRLTQPRFLVGVCTLLRSPDGRYLAFEHRFWEGVRWGVPSGHMEPFESPERTAVRELAEESGVTAHQVRVVHVESGFEHRLEIWCIGRVDITEPPGNDALDGREVTAAALLGPEELLSRIRPEQRQVVGMLLQVS